VQRKTGGGSCKHAHTRAHCRPELLRALLLRSYHQLVTSTAGALCQGCSAAIQRALATSDNVVISRVMGCVIQQPPIRSMKEWHQFIPPQVLQPSPRQCLAQPPVLPAPVGAGHGAGGQDCRAQGCFRTAQILAYSLFILCQYDKRGRGACFSPSS